MVGIWWKNNVRHLLRVQMHLTAFVLGNLYFHSSHEYTTTWDFKLQGVDLLQAKCLSSLPWNILSPFLLYITAWRSFTGKNLRIWNVICIMNCFRWLLDCTATCSQPSLFLGKSLVMIWDNSQTAASLSLTRNPYIV